MGASNLSSDLESAIKEVDRLLEKRLFSTTSPVRKKIAEALTLLRSTDESNRECRRLLTYAITHSNGRNLFSEGFIADAKQVLGL